MKAATECVKKYFLDAVPKSIDPENITVEVTCALQKYARYFNDLDAYGLGN